MNAELLSRAPVELVAKNNAAAARRREAEANDAMDFRFLGDDEGRHAERCIHEVPCTRTYDPRPFAEAEPNDLRMYEGTGIAALYDLPGGEAHVWQLAGWNLGREGSL